MEHLDKHRLRESLEDLERYLGDELAPLLVADSVRFLLTSAQPQLAHAIAVWAAGQLRAFGGELGLSEYLYHGVKKVHMLRDLGLLPGETARDHLPAVLEMILADCPPDIAPSLRSNFELMAAGGEGATRAVDVVHRPGGSGTSRRPPLRSGGNAGPAPAPRGPDSGVSPAVGGELRRFSAFLDRLEARSTTVTAEADETTATPTPFRGTTVNPAQAAQLLVMAAETARSSADLREHWRHLSRSGLGHLRQDQVFQTLSQSLPDWQSPDLEGQTYVPAAATAMERMVLLAETPAVEAERFQQMVRTAIDELNEGRLARAATILGRAERLISDEKINVERAELIRRSIHDHVDLARLREVANDREQHAVLRRALGFFPDLRPPGLIGELDGEPDRNRRRLLVALLEAFGSETREPALDRLEASLSSVNVEPDAWHLQRNLVHLLHRIPPTGPPSPREGLILQELSALTQPLPLVKEAIGSLANLTDDPPTEQCLIERLHDVETALLSPGSQLPADELRRLLGQILTIMARYRTPDTRRALIAHAAKSQRALGNTFEALTELAGDDLSDDPEALASLLTLARQQMPVKVLGLVVGRENEGLSFVLEALTSTPHPDVQELFADVVRRFPRSNVATWAGERLDQWGRPTETTPPVTEPEPGMEGDLEVFGLPNLLQSLRHSQSSGHLHLADPRGAEVARLAIRGGRLVSCQSAGLEGEVAFYRIVEQPTASSFRFFVTEPGATHMDEDLLSVLMEGMRRYDEYQRCRALVPDGLRLQPTGTRPTAPADEQDGVFVREVWKQVKKTASPDACEAAITSDPYRVRSLLAHWVDEGALR